MDDTPSICSHCAENRHLKRLIGQDGGQGYCTLCRRSKPHVYSIGQIAAVLSVAIRENFGPVDEWAQGRWNGDTLETIVQEILRQEVNFLEDLIEAVVATDDHDLRDGGEPFFDTSSNYGLVRHRVTIDHLGERWAALAAELKHRRRFFSATAEDFFASLFADIGVLETWKPDQRSYEAVVVKLPAGMRVYRARAIDPGITQMIIDAPFREVGPPPRNKAESMRMSPKGVVVLYAAMQMETAIAELRPAIGGTVAVVELSLTEQMRVLDFERLERALDAPWSEMLHPDSKTARETLQFLRKLHQLIAAPVVPGREDDYLITQTMAEYLVHIHPLRLDGIQFKSAQRAGGTNVVIFPDRLQQGEADNFPVEYMDGTLSFHRVQRVEYTAEPMRQVRHEDESLELHTEEALQAMSERWRDMERDFED